MDSPHLALALKLSKQAGAIMRENFTLAMEKEWKDDATPVTKTDLEIHDLVLKEIKRTFPDHSILSEEGDDFSEASEYVWICDPVDGTHNFSHGVPTATFALALVKEGVPVLSVILDPFLDRTFSAEKGGGAFLNGKPIHVNENPLLRKSVIGLGKMKKVRNFFPLVEELYTHDVRMITGLSIHYMYALVACGEFSAAFFGGPSPHDITPAKVLIEEAGGTVTDLFGATPERFDRDMDGQLASNGSIHEELLSVLDRVSPHG
ncbi:MAG TPA: inositol monophosphatase [Candidatus Paceibacterota bacterium]|nr:inositol monophosphatase [Candidatus Paceibacterota bacterium]